MTAYAERRAAAIALAAAHTGTGRPPVPETGKGKTRRVSIAGWTWVLQHPSRAANPRPRQVPVFRSAPDDRASRRRQEAKENRQ